MWRWTLTFLVAVAFGMISGCERERPVIPPPGDAPPADTLIDPDEPVANEFKEDDELGSP